LIFHAINDSSVITAVFKAAGYTYGPLLGLFTLGIYTKWQLKDHLVPFVCLIAPIISFIINENSQEWLSGYKFGFMILVLNGALTFLGLFLIRRVEDRS
jgi:hypothetical protein